MNLHFGWRLGWQRETISQASTVNGLGIRSQGHSTTGTSIVRIDAPLGSSRSLCIVVMLSLHSHKAVGRYEHIASRGAFLYAFCCRQHLMGEVIVPRAIANVLLRHHTIPLTIRHHLIIIVTELGIALETLLHLVGPKVGIRISGFRQDFVHGLCIIHVVEISHRLDREKDSLTIGIAGRLRNVREQSESPTFQSGIVVSYSPPFTCSKVVSLGIQHLRSYTSHILAVAVVNRGCLVGK